MMEMCNFTIFIVFDVRSVTEGAPSNFQIKAGKNTELNREFWEFSTLFLKKQLKIQTKKVF